MQSEVLSGRQHFEIAGVVVLAILIFVVNVLVRPQGTTELFLSDHTMFVATEKLSISGWFH